ncbi:hypothetical protein [Streptomyces sp. VRA16 Mangrove soil]|uniref:hypothetical protein n=1 Tax=Streptomyces sp. VRA16 Mangrove soil TaxID=2817434 RepID=UPI001A9CD66A|nr:hypothetical protein [Streptomyces sp. VRA16 Mangrove soil]MBO1330678.1 hypothetical protein [Streptomyces sp. VRA16 Mangrove soil]
MSRTVRRFGAFIAITAMALVGLAYAQSADAMAWNTRADSVWIAPADPAAPSGDTTENEPNQDAAPAGGQVLAAPLDSVW